MVVTHFDSKIRILGSDDRVEYKEGYLQDSMGDHGIIYQTICIDIPAENRLSVWKSHLLEVAKRIFG